MSGRTFDRTRYAREWARRRHEAKLARARMAATRCPRKHGKHGVCGCLLETVVDRMGRTHVVCAWCERLNAGLCRDCPSPVAGRVRSARYCALCKVRHHAEQVTRYQRENRPTLNRKARAYARRKDIRQQRAEYKRQWRKNNPDKVKAQKRRFALRQNARHREYLKLWRARNPEKVREYSARRKAKERAA